MTHVQITTEGFTVDGMRVEVHADDLEVDFSTVPPTVRCTIPADVLDVDLPEVALDVRRATESDSLMDVCVERQRRAVEQQERTNEALAALTERLDRLRLAIGEGVNAVAKANRRGGK